MINSNPLISHRLKEYNYTLIFILIFISRELAIMWYPFIYLKYLSILVFTFSILSQMIIKLNKNISPFLLLIIITLTKIWQYNSQTFFDLFFIFSAISIFLINIDYKVNIYLVNILMIVAYFLIYYNSINLNFSLLSFLTSKTSRTETNTSSFLFTLFSLFFFNIRNYKWFFINFIMLILTYKRITFVSLTFVIILILFSRTNLKAFFKKKYNILVLILVLVNIFYVFITYQFGKGKFDHLIVKLTGLSPGYFTQGRSTLIYLLVKNYISLNFNNAFFFGLGQGTLPLILESKLKYAQLIHNDIFKLFFEHGFFIFITFFYLLYKYSNFFFAILFNLFMLTDNVLIYTPIIICFILLQNKKIKNFIFI